MVNDLTFQAQIKKLKNWKIFEKKEIKKNEGKFLGLSFFFEIFEGFEIVSIAVEFLKMGTGDRQLIELNNRKSDFLKVKNRKFLAC